MIRFCAVASPLDNLGPSSIQHLLVAIELISMLFVIPEIYKPCTSSTGGMTEHDCVSRQQRYGWLQHCFGYSNFSPTSTSLLALTCPSATQQTQHDLCCNDLPLLYNNLP
jgi:hypothetical protein